MCLTPDILLISSDHVVSHEHHGRNYFRKSVTFVKYYAIKLLSGIYFTDTKLVRKLLSSAYLSPSGLHKDLLLVQGLKIRLSIISINYSLRHINIIFGISFYAALFDRNCECVWVDRILDQDLLFSGLFGSDCAQVPFGPCLSFFTFM